ncbi:hypothetical protein PM082_011779 [Marasmius tenuissimus]|nr:hypothetical protein PM082_011779 [Marasmius tenuissimus]
MAHMVGSHTWECPPDRLANSISPKVLKPEALQEFRQSNSYRSISKDNFDFLIQSPTIRSTLTSTDISSFQHIRWPSPLTDGRAFYIPATQFLNTCVDLCTNIYDDVRPKLNLSESTWSSLIFTDCALERDQDSFDPYGDSDDDDTGSGPTSYSEASDTRRRLRETDVFLLWLLDFTGKRRQVIFKAAENWHELTQHLFDRPQAQDSITLLAFTVAIVLDTEHQCFRFLVFHHGGITMSTLLNPISEIGQRAMLKLFLGMLLWQTPGNGGLPWFTDGQRFALPCNDERQEIVGVLEGSRHSSSIPSPSFWIFCLRLSRSDLSTYDNLPLNREENVANQDFDDSIHAVHGPRERRRLAVPTERGRPITRSLQGSVFAATGSGSTDLHALAKGGKRLLAKALWQPLRQVGPAELSRVNLDDEFGVLSPLYSHQPSDSNGVPMTNVLFLPGEYESEEAEDDRITHIPVFQDNPPSRPDARILGMTLTKFEGGSLRACKGPQELRLALAHALFGWLALYQAGYLHRSISLTNLVYFKDGIQTKPFSISRLMSQIAEIEGIPSQYSTRLQELASVHDTTVLVEHLQRFVALVGGGEPDQKTKLLADLTGNVARILQLAHDLGVDAQDARCLAGLVISDGDMVALGTSGYRHPDNDARDRMLSGTTEFMSSRLRGVIEGLDHEYYVHSMIDDVESLFWCFLWAVIFNDGNPPASSFTYERRYREFLKSSSTVVRDWVPNGISVLVGLHEESPNLVNRTNICPLLYALLPVVKSLREVLMNGGVSWGARLLLLQAQGDEAFESLYLLTSHSLAFGIVADFLKALIETPGLTFGNE